MTAKTNGAEFKRFYADISIWPEDAYHDDELVLVDGVEWLPASWALRNGDKLYTRPQPTAQWVGLTDEDRQAVFESLPNALDGFLNLWGWLHFSKAVEAKLREKNAGAQARKPLTDARVAAIVANYCLNVGDWTRNGESVARAIERAHGIGGEA